MIIKGDCFCQLRENKRLLFWRRGSLTQLSHLGLIDEQLQLCNLSPDLVLFADKVMDTLGQLLLERDELTKM